MIPSKDITAAVAQGDNPSDDPALEEGRNERDYPIVHIQAWTCLCGQVNSYWASECGRCGLPKKAPHLPSTNETAASKRIDELEFVIMRAVNLIDNFMPYEARTLLLRTIAFKQ